MNRKKLGIAFGIGILLCGLGCGIAFAQYSGFDYAGEKRIGDENLKTETVEKNIDSNGIIEIMYPGYRCDVSVVADENVPVDKINFDDKIKFLFYLLELRKKFSSVLSILYN